MDQNIYGVVKKWFLFKNRIKIVLIVYDDRCKHIMLSIISNFVNLDCFII